MDLMHIHIYDNKTYSIDPVGEAAQELIVTGDWKNG